MPNEIVPKIEPARRSKTVEKMMAPKKQQKKKKEVNPLAEARNWEDRLRTEQEAPHRWNESWGELFDNGVPHEYTKRLEYLEKQLKTMPAIKPVPKYGQGEAFKEIKVGVDPRRKKMFQEDQYED